MNPIFKFPLIYIFLLLLAWTITGAGAISDYFEGTGKCYISSCDPIEQLSEPSYHYFTQPENDDLLFLSFKDSSYSRDINTLRVILASRDKVRVNSLTYTTLVGCSYGEGNTISCKNRSGDLNVTFKFSTTFENVDINITKNEKSTTLFAKREYANYPAAQYE